MRWITLLLVVSAALWLGGCGGGSSSPPVADAGNAAPPPPGDLPPPSAPGGEGSGTPPEATPPDAGTPPAGEQPSPAGTPDGGAAASGEGYQPPPTPDAPGELSPLAGNPGGTEEGMGPQGPPRPPRVKSWREQAEEALAAGNEKEWFRLIHTNFVINPGSWKELDKQMAWVSALRRPALGARFGVAALYVSQPRDFEGSPQPIGSSELKAAMSSLLQNAGSGGTGGGGLRRARMGKSAEAAGASPGESGGESSVPGGSPAAEQSELVYHAGEFGTKFLSELKSRVESGAYGPIYKEMGEAAARGRQRRANSTDPSGNPSDSGEGVPTPTSDAAGGALAGEGGTGDGSSTSPAPRTEGGARLGTSVVWLGKVASREEVVAAAQKAGVDVVVTFEITLKTNRQTELVTNVTKMRIVTASSFVKKEPKEPDLFVSDGLENRVVLLAREKPGKPEDPLAQQITDAMVALDKACKPVALPAGVTGEAVKRRLAAQIAEKPADPLPLAVEIRYYAVKSVLTEGEAANGTMALLGPAEYAHLVSTTPFELGSEAGVGQMLGRFVSVPSLLDALNVFNTATGNTARAEARKLTETEAAAKGQASPTASSGLKGLLPFGLGGAAKK